MSASTALSVPAGSFDCFDYCGGAGSAAAVAAGMFHPSPSLLYFAHWYAGKSKRHRYAREKRYDPKYQIQRIGRNKFSRKLLWKTNRWNYIQAHRDMP